MIRLLLALLALFAPAGMGGLHEETPPMPDEHSTGTQHERFQAYLPASSSWMAYPIVAHGDLELDLRVMLPPDAAGARISANSVILAREAGDAGGGAGWGMYSHVAEINVDGQRITCCPPADFGLFGYPARGGETEMTGVWLVDGETAWLTIIGAHLDESYPLDIRLRAFGGAFSLGEPRQGTQVELVDLLDAANGNGVNARLLGLQRIGAPGDAESAWAPATSGYLQLGYSATDGASFRLDAEGAGERILDGALVEATGGYVTALGPGAQRIALSELTGDGQSGWTHAVALVAELDVPGQWAQSYTWPQE